MRRTQQIWLAALLATAGFISACGSDDPVNECPDVNENGICDTDEPGHGSCDVMDRDAQGKCPNSTPTCNGTQILVDNVCEDCPTGEIAADNVCVIPSVTCETNEIVVDDACVDCGSDATATNNQCVPHCDDTQILVDNVCVDCAAGQVNDGNNACVADTSDDCDPGEILVDEVCCADANENGLCDADEPGAELCPVEERDAQGECPTVCAPELENAEGSCTCADLDLDALCDSDPADDCFGIENGDDVDEDGFCSDTDCDDDDAYTFPGAPEICGLQVVNDCDNPCYDTTCDVADLAAAKEGKIGEQLFGMPSIRTDVTADVDGQGKVYEVESAATLYFCGPVTFHVDLHASGAEKVLNLRSGLQGSTPALSAVDDDRPVITVSDQARVSVEGLAVEHTQGFAGAEGNGLHCKHAEFSLVNTSFSNNSAKEGGGVHSDGCNFYVEEQVGFNGNSAVFGGGMFITNGSSSESKGANITFGANKTDSLDSGAIHVAAESKVLWNLSPDQPRVNFRGNVNGDGDSSDIRVTNSAVLQIREANFMTPGTDHVLTDDNSYLFGMGEDLACDSSVCTN